MIALQMLRDEGWERKLAERELAGRRVIVTGAASGMGRAIADLFARHGAAQFLVDIDADALAKVSLEGARTMAVDLADTAQVGRAVEQAAAQMGGIDGLVNAAGILRVKPFAETDPDTFRQVLNVNLVGRYNLCWAGLPHLRAAEKATIVNISSQAAIIPPKGMSAYAASKAGLLGLSRVLASELGPKIRVNSIIPGLIDTPMTGALWGHRPGAADDMGKDFALARAGRPEEVAELALFLMGERSSFITGTTTAIDGGSSWH